MEFNPYQRQGQMDHLQSYFFLIGWCLHQPKCGIDYRVPVGEDTNR
jgi:hypothetical protein